MIKIKIRKKEIVIKGHALYDDHGKDIVCASVSSIVITTVNAIKKIDNDAIEYIQKKDQITIKLIKKDKNTIKLIENMVELLEQLEDQYPENIKFL